MSRAKELAKNTVILTVGKLCTQFVSFLLLPLYTVLLSPEEYGAVDLIMSYVALLLPLVSWQYDWGVFRFMLDCRGDPKRIKTLFSSVAIVNIVQVTGFVVLFVLLGRYVNLKYIEYLVASVALNVFLGLLMQFARGLGSMVHYSIGGFVTAAGTIFLNVVFIVFLKMGARGMLLATVCGVLLSCIYMFAALKVWKCFDVRAYDGAVVREVGKCSLPMVPNQLSNWVLSVSDRTIVSFFLGVAANGVFTVANKFSNLVGTFCGFFNTAWVEVVSVHFEDEDRDAFITDMLEIALALFVSVCVGIIAVLPFVFFVMVNESYIEAYWQIPILMIGVIFQVLVGLYSAVYIALKKTGEIAKTTVAGAIINVAVHFTLIRFWGLYAASVSTLVSFAAVALQRRLDIRKYVKIKSNIPFLALAVCVVVWTTVSYYINVLWLNVVTLVLAILYAAYANRKMLRMFGGAIKNLVKK